MCARRAARPRPPRRCRRPRGVRFGILGGTFDPPHIGHLLVAVDAIETLELDHVVLIPAGEQPLKVGATVGTAAQRLDMVHLLAEGDARFEVDPIEIRRGGLSYTVDTLAEYAAREPEAERFFLVGADVLGSFEQWREPERVQQLAHLVVLNRPGPAENDPLEQWGNVSGAGLPPRMLRTRAIDISSTEIRARVRAGRSIRGFVPDAIADYIAAAGLYR